MKQNLPGGGHHPPTATLPSLTRPTFPNIRKKSTPASQGQQPDDGTARPRSPAPAAGRGRAEQSGAARSSAAVSWCHSPSRASALSLRSRAATSSPSPNCHIPPERRGKARSGKEKLRRRQLPRGLGGHSAGGRRSRQRGEPQPAPCAVAGGRAGRGSRSWRGAERCDRSPWRREEDLLKIAARLGVGVAGGRRPGCAALPTAALPARPPAAAAGTAPRGSSPGQNGDSPTGFFGHDSRRTAAAWAWLPGAGGVSQRCGRSDGRRAPPAEGGWRCPYLRLSCACPLRLGAMRVLVAAGARPTAAATGGRQGFRRGPGKAGPAHRPRHAGLGLGPAGLSQPPRGDWLVAEEPLGH